MLYILILAPECPSGYTLRPGSFTIYQVGTDHEIASQIFESIQECANHCSSNTNCKSIEWSEFRKHCEILATMHPEGPQHQDYRFCLKVEGVTKKVNTQEGEYKIGFLDGIIILIRNIYCSKHYFRSKRFHNVPSVASH